MWYQADVALHCVTLCYILLEISQVDLKKVSENAQKQYVKSRPQPSPESVKRSKELPFPLPSHPLFGVCVCVCVRVRACVRACVHACVRV